MPNFLHGVNVTEINEGISTVRTSSSSVIGVIGTAPDASATDFPLNTPVLIAGSLTEAAKLGNSGTLPAALDGILAQTSAAVVVVRIAEGVANGEGDDAILYLGCQVCPFPRVTFLICNDILRFFIGRGGVGFHNVVDGKSFKDVLSRFILCAWSHLGVP